MTSHRMFNYSPEYLTLLLESGNQGVLACDNQFNVTFRNKRMMEIHGFPESQSLQNWFDYIQIMELDAETPTPYEQYPVNLALRGNTVKDKYYVLKRRDLDSILVKYTARPLYADDGMQIGAILTAENCDDMVQSIARFQAIFEQSPLSIQIVNKTGKTVLVNSAFKKLWSISDDFVRDFILEKYNIQEDQVLIKSGKMEFINKAFGGEIAHIPEFLYDPATVNLPGRSRFASGLIFPLKDSKNEVQEVVIIHQDVTDERDAIEERERLYAQLEAILRQLPAGLMVTDTEGNISLYNDQMRQLIGEPNKAKEVFKESLSKSLKGEFKNSDEIRINHPGGGASVLSTSSGPIFDSEGNITSSIIISSDVTREKRDETNQLYLAGVKSILISIIDYDQILDKIAASAIPYLADGCMVDIVEGNTIKRIVSKHRDPRIQNFMLELQSVYSPDIDSPHPSSRAMRTGRAELLPHVDSKVIKAHTIDEKHAELIEKIGVRSNIAIPLQIRGEIIGALNLFITIERPNYDEKDLAVAIELARHASVAIDNAKLYKDAKSAIQLRDDFISIASHELRTPITSLNLQIEVLSNIIENHPHDLEGMKLMKKFFGNTKNQLRRLTRLVDDMLDITRISSGKLSLNLRKVNLTSLIHAVIERFKDQLKASDIAYEFLYHSEVFVTCDSEKIDQVITNFMTNAIRYGQRSPIHISLEDSEHQVVIQFKDHGRGISARDQERIFKRFERAHTDEDVNGLGLGLYINTQIIEEHQGTIKLVSELGAGSNFIVELPKVRT